MSGKVVGWAFDDPNLRGLSPTERYVLVAYADNADRWGKCWPDKPEIIDKTGLSRATVYRAIKVLEKGGHLQFTEDEKDRECILLAVPWASHCETDESQGETEPSHCETDESQGETGSNKEPSLNRQEPSCVAKNDPDFSILPAAVAAPLRQVAEAKDATIDPAAVKRACETYPDRDHAEEAERFAEWHLHRNPNAPARSIAQGFRNWLKRAAPAKPGRAHLRPVDSPPEPAPPANFRDGLPELTAVWPAVAERLQRSVKPSTYGQWLEPLRPAGKVGNAVYLTAPDQVRGWVQRRYTTLIAEGLAAEGMPEVKVLLIAPPEDAGEVAA